MDITPLTPEPTERNVLINRETQPATEQDDIDIAPFDTPTRPPPRSGRRSAGGGSSKKMTTGTTKWKRRLWQNDGQDGVCHLLNLPVDVLHVLLSRLPPRSLKALSVTCKTLKEDLEDESIWRQSYANRFLWDGAAKSAVGRDNVKVLVQGCTGDVGRGWRKEALNREAMLDRWVDSKQDMVIHHPPLGLIHTLSLSYPKYSPPAPRSLVVGKQHATPSKADPSTPASTPSVNGDDPSLSTPTPSKLTHRQKYEALIAATTRPAPYVLSASLFLGSIVRSDPLSGKASKGFWGPGKDANFHLRPHLDQSAEPSAIYLPVRSQTQALWGLVNGSCVHTTLASKSQSSQGGRATSVNVLSGIADAHEGEVCDIWMDTTDSTGPVRWVTGGTDGLVKYWHLNPAQGRSGKRSPIGDIPGSITCLFTSSPILDTLPNRADYVKRRQTGKPDDVTIVRSDTAHQVVCGVTEDGDLRIWFDAGSGKEREIRLDVGSAEEMGGVKHLELDVKKDHSASILVMHHRSPAFARYDIIAPPDGNLETSSRVFQSPAPGAFSAIHACLRSAPAISTRTILPPILSTPAPTREDDETDESSTTTSPVPTPSSSSTPSSEPSNYGRFVVTGDEHGVACIWKWDIGHGEEATDPIRAWPAMNGRITSIDASCGLVAFGSFDGWVKVYDPLPSPPVLLRSFHASRLSAADAFVAATHEPDARYFNVNQVILENDLIVASIGRKVFAWKAGIGKGRTKGDSHRKAPGQKSDSKGALKSIDKKSLRQESLETQNEIRTTTAPPVRQSNFERAQFAAMDNLGLEDGDDALQYALMLSMETQESIPDEYLPVVGAEGDATEDDIPGDHADTELQEMLEEIRLAEERERDDRST